MLKSTFQIVLCLLLCTRIVLSQWKWDFAVTTSEKIIFYDEKWSEVTSAAHQFEELSAITFDEIQERIYFNDQMHNNGSIFSLKLDLSKSNSPVIENIIMRTPNEKVAAITYDPLNRNLFWTDESNKKIYFFPIYGNETTKPKVLFDFTDEDTIPDGIVVDICRRKIYWTNSNRTNPSIQVASLSGENRTTLIDTDLYYPHGIFVDQLTDRIFYVVDQAGVHYTVESANLDGTDRKIIVKDIDSVPFSLTVTSDYIYWTDLVHKAIWKVSKDNTSDGRPIKVKDFPGSVRGIVARIGMPSKLKGDKDCKSVMQKIDRLAFPKSNRTEILKKREENHDLICLGMGLYSEVSKACSCYAGYSGARCETYECHNYCVHGTCGIVDDTPKCTCKQGFTGDRCQTSKCNDHCLNDGLCRIVKDEPVCDCHDDFLGDRCENNATETCRPFCILLQKEIEVNIPLHCGKACKNFDPNIEMPWQKECRSWNKSIIVVVVGILGGLALIYLIIHAIRRIYKPARPRIKKTFVVQKKISQTPLTSRPIATEQCEITIENCCNMNICDTPCFDPKLLQQNMANESRKEDKLNLIQNMENEIY